MCVCERERERGLPRAPTLRSGSAVPLPHSAAPRDPLVVGSHVTRQTPCPPDRLHVRTSGVNADLISATPTHTRGGELRAVTALRLRSYSRGAFRISVSVLGSLFLKLHKCPLG